MSSLGCEVTCYRYTWRMQYGLQEACLVGLEE